MLVEVRRADVSQASSTIADFRVDVDVIAQGPGAGVERTGEESAVSPSASISSARRPRVLSAPLFALAGRTHDSRKSGVGGLASLSSEHRAISGDHRNWFST